MPRRRANGHRQHRIPTHEHVDVSPRDNGRVIPWWTIFMMVLQVLSFATILVLRAWNTDLETQFNRSETRAANLASDLRATRLDLEVKLQELDVCKAGQLRLRTNLTECDRQLAGTNRELLRIEKHWLMCVSLNEKLNTTIHLLAERAAEALNERDEARNERDEALQRQRRQTKLLRACDIKREDLKDRLEQALRRLEEAEQEKAERKERRNHQQHRNHVQRHGGSEFQDRGFSGMLWDAGKQVLIHTGKKVVAAIAEYAFGPVASTVVNFVSGFF